jgi:hypothetical protein
VWKQPTELPEKPNEANRAVQLGLYIRLSRLRMRLKYSENIRLSIGDLYINSMKFSKNLQ